MVLSSLNAGATSTITKIRPYLMPKSERDRILHFIKKEDWAKEDYIRVKHLADNDDGFWSAFLYALEEDERYLPAAKKWLLKYGGKGGDISIAKDRLSKPDFFKGGQPWISPVYYNLDISHMVAYDWVYKGLTPAEREIVADGILTSARFRMKCMDRWSQTPNLVLKPTYMVAIAGLSTDNKELLDWGFHRKAWSTLGGYFPVLNLMLRDGGPWAEAPIYPIAHKSLLLMCKMSKYQNLLDGKDWFSHKSPNGGSPKGLIDYFIDTAYPIERTGYGEGQIRVATYGDGATGANGDLFLVNPAGPGLNLHDELAEAYNISDDLRYAQFLKMVLDYKPNLWDRRPLPTQVKWPEAPSRVWPNYGLAMLRSDESPSYWTNKKAIAVFHVMSQGYGHDHRDKFNIMLYGAGHLLYPDYNALQYENPAIGWTRNTVSHNTLLVDEKDTRDVWPSNICHEFSTEVKFLATSASGVFEGIDQTRVLFLTHEYLLDIFHASGKVPHVYDYLLHSFGRALPVAPNSYRPSTELVKRYWRVENQKTSETNNQWQMDFVIDEDTIRRKEDFDLQWLSEKAKEKTGKKQSQQIHFGPEWYAHKAAVRLTVAGEPNTLVGYGEGPHELAALIIRRKDLPDTDFVTVHEPFANSDQPQIHRITKLARSKNAMLVRVEGAHFTDYAAVAFGPGKNGQEHALASEENPKTSFAFQNYGYLRISKDGKVIARGDWTGFRIPGTVHQLVVNGKSAKMMVSAGFLDYGKIPPLQDPPMRAEPVCPLTVEISPKVIRLFPRDRRTVILKVQNPLSQAVSGRIDFDLPEGFSTEPAEPHFGPINAGSLGDIPLVFVANKPNEGLHTIPYWVVYKQKGTETDIRTAAKGVTAAVGPVLESIYQHPEPAVYKVSAPKYTAKFDMFHGLLRYLADDDDTIRLNGSPLFTLSDGTKRVLFDGTDHAFTWPTEVPARLTAHAYDRCRWNAIIFGDRIMFKMDRDWTQFDQAYFTIPGNWISPKGNPQWRRIVTADGSDVDFNVEASSHISVSAAELAFPGSNWNLCFQFLPAQEILFVGTEMKFQLNTLQGDEWMVGFCQPDDLDNWKWKTLPNSLREFVKGIIFK